ncbi:flagellar hook-associated protein FlgK [Cryobacterium sp. TMS1-20-1]|uniref:flagellar hook-associated protein FlgK n=1 Tax=Cryobacterium sp. TMS1-20-1 TaxID=1259223 RepID=UPI00106B40E5|nr:flagellar hook-associated protein FlgK [Cryobacterium sp. TMS1-20-1]TFC75595.1 flagellar hook-associated protein FlgK [Cryobacterium sp. TMS1-20-1]
MSTFSGLNTAYSGLVAARAGLDVVGQNIANANTDGYTRQRLSTNSTSALAQTGVLANNAFSPGAGVTVTGIVRLASAQLDAHVRAAANSAGYTAVRANALSVVEGSFREPGDDGISAQLQDFWDAWADLSNSADQASPAALLLVGAGALTNQIAAGYRAVEAEWNSVRGELDTMAAELNSSAEQIDVLNAKILAVLTGGGNANELLDERTQLTTTMSALTGATVRDQGNGTVSVFIGGNAIVSEFGAKTVTVTGTMKLAGLGVAGGAVGLAWGSGSSTPVGLDGGEMAGALSLLTAANTDGTGGMLAEAAASYNNFAADLATQVNAAYSPDDADPFFEFTAESAALSLRVIPTSTSDVRAGTGAGGAFDGSVADAVAQIGTQSDSPDSNWLTFVNGFVVNTRSELQAASLASLAQDSAVGRQLANSTVDLDEENVSLLMYQHAYQGAARMLTAIDEMLDTLINRTGLVGR